MGQMGWDGVDNSWCLQTFHWTLMFISLTSNRLLSLYLEYLAYTLKKKIQKIAYLFKQYFNRISDRCWLRSRLTYLLQHDGCMTMAGFSGNSQSSTIVIKPNSQSKITAVCILIQVSNVQKFKLINWKSRDATFMGCFSAYRYCSVSSYHMYLSGLYVCGFWELFNFIHLETCSVVQMRPLIILRNHQNTSRNKA